MLARVVRRRRRLLLAVSAALVACPMEGCLTSTLAKRFRDAYAPGLAEGLALAVSQPGTSEAGLRRAWSALFEGLGALVQTRNADN